MNRMTIDTNQPGENNNHDSDVNDANQPGENNNQSDESDWDDESDDNQGRGDQGSCSCRANQRKRKTELENL
jgi:hypothetical protein